MRVITALGALAAAAAATTPAAAPPPLTASLLAGAAASGVAQLLTFYNSSTGQFGPPEDIPFWTTANSCETLVNYYVATGDVSVLEVVADVHAKAWPRYCDCWRDDHLWYILAWARAGEVTGSAQYVDTAQAIMYNLTVSWSSWNKTCGGVGWENGNPYVNSITNELFMSATTKLALMTDNSTLLANFTYAGWATTDYDWFMGTPLIQPSGLIVDGLDTHNCAATQGAVWSYNQGVILSALAALPALRGGDNATLSQAATLAATALAHFGAGTPTGDVLVETACGAGGVCGGLDGQQFKGVFVRHLGYALPALAAAGLPAVPTSTLAASWLRQRALSRRMAAWMAAVVGLLAPPSKPPSELLTTTRSTSPSKASKAASSRVRNSACDRGLVEPLARWAARRSSPRWIACRGPFTSSTVTRRKAETAARSRLSRARGAISSS